MPVVYIGMWVPWRLMPLVSDRAIAIVIVGTYETFVGLATGALVANAILLAWTFAAFSLSVAAWFTRRARVST